MALVYGENNEENETIDRSSFVWIFNNRNHMHDFYQCVYADSGWREAETLIFAKKNNKNTDEESSALFHHHKSQIKKSSHAMSQKKNICLSSSFFSDLSLSFSRRRQK